MRTQRRFAGQPGSVAAARRFAGEVLAGLPADTVDDVSVMVSELTTNALLHAATDFDITIDHADGLVRVEVIDSGRGTPTMQWPQTDELHGRGLHIVEELSDDWGISRSADHIGKSVWFSLALPPVGPTGGAWYEAHGRQAAIHAGSPTERSHVEQTSEIQVPPDGLLSVDRPTKHPVAAPRSNQSERSMTSGVLGARGWGYQVARSGSTELVEAQPCLRSLRKAISSSFFSMTTRCCVISWSASTRSPALSGVQGCTN